MNYINKYKRILSFFIVLISLFCISYTYKINIDKNKIININLSQDNGYTFNIIYNNLIDNYDDKFSLFIKSIDNSPIILPLLVEIKLYNLFKTNNIKLCKVTIPKKNSYYIDSLNSNRILCIKDTKTSKNINFIKFAGPVDKSIIIIEKFEYRSQSIINFIL